MDSTSEFKGQSPLSRRLKVEGRAVRCQVSGEEQRAQLSKNGALIDGLNEFNKNDDFNASNHYFPIANTMLYTMLLPRHCHDIATHLQYL